LALLCRDGLDIGQCRRGLQVEDAAPLQFERVGPAATVNLIARDERAGGGTDDIVTGASVDRDGARRQMVDLTYIDGAGDSVRTRRAVSRLPSDGADAVRTSRTRARARGAVGNRLERGLVIGQGRRARQAQRPGRGGVAAGVAPGE